MNRNRSDSLSRDDNGYDHDCDDAMNMASQKGCEIIVKGVFSSLA